MEPCASLLRMSVFGTGRIQNPPKCWQVVVLIAARGHENQPEAGAVNISLTLNTIFHV